MVYGWGGGAKGQSDRPGRRGSSLKSHTLGMARDPIALEEEGGVTCAESHHAPSIDPVSQSKASETPLRFVKLVPERPS